MKYNKKRFVSSSFILTLYILCFAIFGSVGIIGIIVTLHSKAENLIFNISSSIAVLVIGIASLLIGSKLVYTVSIDDDSIVLRTIWGVHSEVAIQDIVRIYVVPFAKGDISMMCIEDGRLRSLNMLRRNSLIRIQCSKKSVKILKTYCSKKIENLPNKFE